MCVLYLHGVHKNKFLMQDEFSWTASRPCTLYSMHRFFLVCISQSTVLLCIIGMAKVLSVIDVLAMIGRVLLLIQIQHP